MRGFRTVLLSLFLPMMAGGAETLPSIPTSLPAAVARPQLLNPDALKHYVEAFNRDDRELYPQAIANVAAWDFLKTNVPLFECPDPAIEQTYLFRWWTYRKHIKRTSEGYVITEFLPPVPWAGKYNAISCPSGHHLHEGRWLNDPVYLDDYSVFWFRRGGSLRTYTCWLAESIWARFLVTGDDRLARALLPDFVANFEAWEKARRDPNRLFWQVDGQDGGEVSISGALHPGAEGYRATINSYMYGEAQAIANLAERCGDRDLALRFRATAQEIRHLVESRLWDPEAQFFKVIPRTPGAGFSDARELHGYTPWYFELASSDKAVAWKQLMDPAGFYAPFGPTTAERRHPKFAVSYSGHECQWNGPSWPFATAITLTAMANLLNDYRQEVVTAKDYVDLLKIYTRCHRLKLDDGREVPWIDENLNPMTGDWLARTRLKTWKNGTWDPEKGGEERGKDYNHSTYCDLVISGLVGLRPRADNILEVNPLVPPDWDYFCLDQVRYHGHWLTVAYDRTGRRYGKGAGLRIFCDGRLLVSSKAVRRLTIALPGAR